MPAPMRTKRSHPIPTRDPALNWLAAESRSFAKQNAEDAPGVRKLREQCEREISSLPEVKTHLDKLKDRGVNLERVLKCLAAFVLLKKHGTWQATADANKATLRNLAKRLRRIADKVEGAYGADANRPDLFAMSLGFLVPASLYDHREAVEYMRETAADLETKARGFGRLRKDIIPVVERDPIVKLLRHVCKPEPDNIAEFPPKLRQQLAELGHAVCERYGINDSFTFTAENLDKTFKRYCLRPSK
jgi:hypothetical protein